jgi:hypothetical protein
LNFSLNYNSSMKTCTTCKIEKNLTEFHKHSGSKDGHHWKCKKCVAHYQKELKTKYKKARGEMPEDWAIGKTKICTQCIATKELSEFNKDVTTKDGYKPYCRACLKIYKDANKDKTAAYNEATKEHRKIKAAKYFQENKEAIYEYRKTDKVVSYHKKYLKDNEEKIASQQKKWNSENKGLVRAHRAKRRAQIKQATVPWADIDAINKIYDDCVRLSQESGIEHQVDHIVPLQHEQVCGLHWEGNLRIITREENQSKHNKLMD